MAKTLRRYIFITFIVCCASVAILVTSLATNSWVTLDAQFTMPGNDSAEPYKQSINYGLFSGITERAMSSFFISQDVTVTCSFDNNVCAVLLSDVDIDELYEKSGDSSKFINAGLWTTTVFFLVLSIVLAVCAGFLAVVNTAANPIHTILSVRGLYIWNCLPAASCLLCLIIWGSQFAVTLIDNVPILETISNGVHTTDQSSLGYSYWILLVPIFFHAANNGVLYFRSYLVEKSKPPPTIHTEDIKTDGTIFLY